MAKGFKHGGGGGGGSSLNFNVVLGTSQPSSPKENDIWVNTSNTSNAAWVFSATQPTGQTNLIWIKIGTDSGAAFNALTENGIWVYPIEAKQYVNRAWKDVTAKSYIGGKWVEWVTDFWLFDYGALNTSVTGGFVKKNTAGDGVNLTNNSDGSITLIPNSSGSNQFGYAMYYTANKIDLSSYSKIHFYGVLKEGGQNRVGIGVYSAITSFTENRVAQMSGFTDNSNTEHTLDISSVNGSYHIALFIGDHANNDRAVLCRLWLTK